MGRVSRWMTVVTLALAPMAAWAEDAEETEETEEAKLPEYLTDAKSFYDSVASVTMGDSFDDTKVWLLDGEKTLTIGEIDARFNKGWLFPVWSGKTAEEWAEIDEKAKKAAGDDWEEPGPRGERQLVGVVFVGEGELDLSFTRREYGRQFANHMVMNAGMEKDKLAPVTRGVPFTTGFTEAWVTKAGTTLAEWTSDLEVVYEPKPDDADATVMGGVDIKELKKAYDKATKLFEDRTGIVSFVGGTNRRLASDRLSVEHRGNDPEGVRTFADFLTDTRYHLVNEAKTGDFREDRFLTVSHDPTGNNSAQNISQVGTIGDNNGRPSGATLAVTRFPSWNSDPLGPQLPESRWDPVHIDQHYDVNFHEQRFYLAVDGVQKFTVKAVGDQDSLGFRFPRQEALKDTWKLKGLHLEDGTPLVWYDPESEDFQSLSGQLGVLLPEPVKDGEEITVVIEYEGTWPYANVMKGESAAFQGSLGLSTGLQMIAPDLSVHFGGGATVHSVLTIPEDADLEIALSGVREPDRKEGGRLIAEANTKTTALYPGVAVGKWRSYSEDAVPGQGDQPGFPSITVHMFTESEDLLPQFPPEMRRVISIYQQFLGAFPWDEIELFQAPDQFFGYVWIAPHGMVNLQEVRVTTNTTAVSAFRDGTPHMESGVLSHEIAHQYWGHTARASHISEGWVNETMSETMACLYVGLAYGQDEEANKVPLEERSFEARMQKYREVWEEKVPDDAYAPLPRAYESSLQPLIVYNYGPYVMHKMLRRRIGDPMFFGSIDVFINEHRQDYIGYEQFMRTFKDAARAFESKPELGPIPNAERWGMSSEKYLDQFFKFWMEDGYIPEIDVTWRMEGKKLVGTAKSNIPFGTFDFPLVVSSGKRRVAETWVLVKNGEGTFELEASGNPKKFKVEIDPDGYILARKRSVTRE